MTGTTGIPTQRGDRALPLSLIPTAAAGVPTAEAPVWRPGYEWEYRWESPRGKGTFVWSVNRTEIVDGTEFYVVKAGGVLIVVEIAT